MSGSLPLPHGLQHTRLPCPALTPGACSNSCPLSCCCHLLLPSFFPSIRVFSNKSVLLIRWPKYCSFSISPSNEHSFRIDWFDLHAVQGTINNLLQHHKSKASILRCSAFFMVQLSHSYMLLSHFSRVQLCATPYMAAHQALPSLEFSRQEHWSGLPFPSPMHESEK